MLNMNVNIFQIKFIISAACSKVNLKYKILILTGCRI